MTKGSRGTGGSERQRPDILRSSAGSRILPRRDHAPGNSVSASRCDGRGQSAERSGGVPAVTAFRRLHCTSRERVHDCRSVAN